MSQQRGISRVVNVPALSPGFVGPGHLAAPVVSPKNFDMTDPFILLMDDHLVFENCVARNVSWQPCVRFDLSTRELQGSLQ